MARNRFTEKLGKVLNTNPFKNFFKLNRMRPPGAVAEKEFMELCIRCARCIEVCPYDSIHRADLFDKLQIGTPYIYAETRACYLCMKCPSVCPTGALNPKLTVDSEVRIGIAVINQDTCLNYLYYKEEIEGVSQGYAQLCNTCNNVCPFTDEAIYLEKFILPIVTDKCTGCGICTEKCPTTPKSINIYPIGMGVKEEGGFYSRKNKLHGKTEEITETLHGQDLIDTKRRMTSFGSKDDFKYNVEIKEDEDVWQNQ
ncbi:MAG: nitrate reductase [Denitrovibrio sp.]|nr:MAG: nitrate reductase [Denitrovibrio sp.]